MTKQHKQSTPQHADREPYNTTSENAYSDPTAAAESSSPSRVQPSVRVIAAKYYDSLVAVDFDNDPTASDNEDARVGSSAINPAQRKPTSAATSSPSGPDCLMEPLLPELIQEVKNLAESTDADEDKKATVASADGGTALHIRARRRLVLVAGADAAFTRDQVFEMLHAIGKDVEKDSTLDRYAAYQSALAERRRQRAMATPASDTTTTPTEASESVVDAHQAVAALRAAIRRHQPSPVGGQRRRSQRRGLDDRDADEAAARSVDERERAQIDADARVATQRRIDADPQTPLDGDGNKSKNQKKNDAGGAYGATATTDGAFRIPVPVDHDDPNSSSANATRNRKGPVAGAALEKQKGPWYKRWPGVLLAIIVLVGIAIIIAGAATKWTYKA